MRLLFAAFAACVSVYSVDGQTVAIYNSSHPLTSIEVGDTVQISIEGAATNGTVTVVFDGGGPYFEGYTDGTGSFLVSTAETSYYKGAHAEYWYVDGAAMAPNNPNATYLPYAPALPSFTVYDNYFASNCPAQSTSTSGCGTGNMPQHWIWTPVTFYSTSSMVSNSSASAEAGNWNDVQSRIDLTNESDPLDIWIYDVTSLPDNTDNALTTTYGQDCNDPCYGYLDDCNGACANSASVYYVNIELNSTTIAARAPYLGLTTSEYAAVVLEHELGHALRLGHTTMNNYKVAVVCSEVQSVMYPSGTGLVGCDLTTPNSCDVGGIDAVYPSAPGYCTPGENVCTSQTSCS